MFEKNKSFKFLFPYILLIVLFFSVVIGNIIFSYGKNYKTIFKNDIYKISNVNLYVKDIYLYEDNFYIEFINKNWLEDVKISFNAKTKNDEKEELKDILNFKFKGLYVLKIPIKTSFKAILLTTILNENEKFYIYFNENEIVKRKDGKDEKKLKFEYITCVINFNIDDIKVLENNIKSKEKEIEKLENENKKIEQENPYSVEEEKEKIESKLSEIKSKKDKILSEILEIKNKIISLKNKNILLENEKKFIETGEKIELKNVKLFKKIDEKGKEIADTETIKNIEKEEEKEKAEKKKEDNKNKENMIENEKKTDENYNPNNNPNSTYTPPKINTEKTKNDLPNTNNNKNTSSKKTPKKNNISTEIKSKKTDNKGEVEVEFVP
ncbi:MAG: hypothetical protein SOR31_04255 [Parvimonas sp.]|uniref:hypothetical protein n=1 Tax=Parvimonas sp. TaxID=1944660 RepID=UPI002A75CB83|nr:hypothetical protein [Parvimonas sp.]MDY3050829.1 hypothetical protein [Parvimonas sp.]